MSNAMRTYRTLLQQRNFRLLFVAQAISALGTWIGLIALNGKIFAITQSALGVATLFLFMVVPSLLFGIIGGVYVDRYNRKWLLVCADSARTIFTLLVLTTTSALPLYSLVFLNAVVGVIYRTARLAIMPTLVGNKEDLLSANALLMTTQTLTLTFGTALGGLLVATLGIEAAFVLDALSFALSALLIARIDLTPNKVPASTGQRKHNLFRQGFDFVRNQRILALIMIATSVMVLGSGAVNALEIVYAHSVLQVGDVGFGLLLSAWGGGLCLGSLWSGWLGARVEHGRLFVAAMALLGLAFALYGYAPFLSVAIVVGIIGGMGNGLLLNLIQTLLQTLTPSEMLGRVGGFFTTVRDVMQFVSMLAAGVLADLIGVQLVFLVAGLIVLVAAGLPLVFSGVGRARLNWLASTTE